MNKYGVSLYTYIITQYTTGLTRLLPDFNFVNFILHTPYTRYIQQLVKQLICVDISTKDNYIKRNRTVNDTCTESAM